MWKIGLVEEKSPAAMIPFRAGMLARTAWYCVSAADGLTLGAAGWCTFRMHVENDTTTKSMSR